jgi:hypothetical protein
MAVWFCVHASLETGRQATEQLADEAHHSRVSAKLVAAAAAAAAVAVLQAFGRGRQVPKRIYTIQELRLNKLEPEKLLSPTDVSLNTVRNIAQGAAAAGLVALAYFAGMHVMCRGVRRGKGGGC